MSTYADGALIAACSLIRLLLVPSYSQVHHCTLSDMQARGYVRPICISYVTSDPHKVMMLFEDLLTEFSKVTAYLKYDNHALFLADLERRHADLLYTRSLLMSDDPAVRARIPTDVRHRCWLTRAHFSLTDTLPFDFLRTKATMASSKSTRTILLPFCTRPRS